MNCHEFWRLLPDRNSGLDSNRRLHLTGCAPCAAEFARRSRLNDSVRALAADSQGIEAPVRVEARLLAAFRAENGLAVVPYSRRPWRAVAAWAAAAAAVLAGAFLLARGLAPETPRQHAQNTVELAMLQAPTENSAAVPDNAARFIPLPNAEILAPDEEVNVVRVEVPRSAMMAVGLAVSEDRALERVQADVMLGLDGLPRAVRFLDEY